MVGYRSKIHSPLDAGSIKYRTDALSPLDANPIKYRSRENSPLSIALPPYLYQHSLSLGSYRNFRMLDRANFGLLKTIPWPNTNIAIPGSHVAVVRENNYREFAYVDGDGNIYLMCGGTVPVYNVYVIKFNIYSEAYSILTVATSDNVIGFTDGYIYDGHCYFSRHGAYNAPKLYKISLNPLAVVASAGVNYVIDTAHGIIVAPDYNTIYILDRRYDPFYTRVYRFTLSSLAYHSLVQTVAGDTSASLKAGFIRIGDRVIYLARNSSTTGGGLARLVRFDLPAIVNITSSVVSSGTGLALCLDSSKTIGYVLTDTTLYKYDLTPTPMTEIQSVALVAGITDATMTIDEKFGLIYVSVYHISFSRIYVYKMSDLSFVSYTAVAYTRGLFLLG